MDLVPFFAALLMILLGFVFGIYRLNAKWRRQFQKAELDRQKLCNRSLDQILESLRHFRHTYNNNLNIIYGYAQAEEYGKLIDYFDRLMDENDRAARNFNYNIRNAALFSVVSLYSRRAGEAGVELGIEAACEIREIENIQMGELYEMLDYFLGAAVKGASQSREREVGICVDEDEKSILITLTNSCGNPPGSEKLPEDISNMVRRNRHLSLSSHYDEGVFYIEISIDK